MLGEIGMLGKDYWGMTRGSWRLPGPATYTAADLGFRTFKIEAEPRAEGFILAVGAVRVEEAT